MGDQHRLKLYLAVLVAASAAGGCGGSNEDERKLLQTQDRVRARQERIDNMRVVSPEGELLPSEVKVGRIVMPRGFEVRFSDPHEWTYEGEFPLDKVEAYFARRVTYTKSGKTDVGALEYRGVREKSDPNMPGAVLRLSQAPARPDRTTIYVAEPGPTPPPQPMMTEEEIRQLTAEHRRNER